ncbi:MAG: GNAT family N-acetyltransferase [Vulcanimicrobiaceae bacterium]
MRALRIEGRETEALTYLAQAPYDNVFISYLLLFDSGAYARNNVYIAVDDRDCIRGVAYFGRQVVLACDDEALDALATVGRDFRGERMIVGPCDTVRGYWKRVQGSHAPPRLVRERQPVMAIDRARLRPYERKTIVRRARIDEWMQVADNSAAMIEQELDYDPRTSSPEFATNVRAMIDRGLWWVGESLGRLCFYCNVGPWTARTTQLQGIWTPPEMRGKGLAASSLAAICDRLLEGSPTLSLYVNDYNQTAIALYERIGFETVGAFQTLLF